MNLSFIIFYDVHIPIKLHTHNLLFLSVDMHYACNVLYSIYIIDL